ncbi:hypothetical protein ACQQ2T_15515 (plasmid) [Paraclostridium tenue]
MNYSIQIDKCLLGKVGLDRVKFLVSLECIDFLTLKSQETLSYADPDSFLKMEVIDKSTGEYVCIKEYKHCVVIDNGFKSEVSYGIEIKKQSNGPNKPKSIVCELDITFPRVCYNTIHNIYNVHKSEDVTGVILNVINQLELDGIYLKDPRTWTIKSLEVNKTFELDSDQKKFDACMKYIIDLNRQNKFYKESHGYNDNGSNSYSFKSNRQHLKIYNKSNQILNSYSETVDKNLIRVELRLTRDGVFNSFKSNSISIIFDMDSLNKLYKDTTKKFYKNIKKSINTEVEFFINNLTQSNLKSMDLLASQNSEKLFDIIYISEAAYLIYEKNQNNHLQRDLKKLFDKIDPHKIGRFKVLEKFFKLVESENNNLYDFSKKIKQYLN